MGFQVKRQLGIIFTRTGNKTELEGMSRVAPGTTSVHRRGRNGSIYQHPTTGAQHFCFATIDLPHPQARAGQQWTLWTQLPPPGTGKD